MLVSVKRFLESLVGRIILLEIIFHSVFRKISGTKEFYCSYRVILSVCAYALGLYVQF